MWNWEATSPLIVVLLMCNIRRERQMFIKQPSPSYTHPQLAVHLCSTQLKFTPYTELPGAKLDRTFWLILWLEYTTKSDRQNDKKRSWRFYGYFYYINVILIIMVYCYYLYTYIFIFFSFYICFFIFIFRWTFLFIILCNIFYCCCSLKVIFELSY